MKVYVMINHKREMQMYSLTACSLKRAEVGGGIVYKKREQLTEILVVIFVLFFCTREVYNKFGVMMIIHCVFGVGGLWCENRGMCVRQRALISMGR